MDACIKTGTEWDVIIDTIYEDSSLWKVRPPITTEKDFDWRLIVSRTEKSPDEYREGDKVHVRIKAINLREKYIGVEEFVLTKKIAKRDNARNVLSQNRVRTLGEPVKKSNKQKTGQSKKPQRQAKKKRSRLSRRARLYRACNGPGRLGSALAHKNTRKKPRFKAVTSQWKSDSKSHVDVLDHPLTLRGGHWESNRRRH